MRSQLALRPPMTHLQTFARLHDARPTDAPALRMLAESLPAGPGGERPVWPLLIEAGGAHILVATECQLPVGAAVIWHRKDAAGARLSWLGVAPSARGRGIGRLLLETAIAAVAAHRAQSLIMRLPPDADQLTRFLLDHGFTREKGGIMRLPLYGTAP
jgi:GNAT superfamily N-acetyltransferase